MSRGPCGTCPAKAGERCVSVDDVTTPLLNYHAGRSKYPTTTVHIAVPLAEKIDKVRGDMTRSEWVRRAIDRDLRKTEEVPE